MPCPLISNKPNNNKNRIPYICPLLPITDLHTTTEPPTLGILARKAHAVNVTKLPVPQTSYTRACAAETSPVLRPYSFHLRPAGSPLSCESTLSPFKRNRPTHPTTVRIRIRPVPEKCAHTSALSGPRKAGYPHQRLTSSDWRGRHDRQGRPHNLHQTINKTRLTYS